MSDRKWLLVVDDEPELRELLCEELDSAGYRVETAGNAKEALALVGHGAGEFDLVLSDVRMPGGGGVELLETLRSRSPERPPLVFYTGYSDLSIEDAYDKGAVGIFPKPTEFRELVDKLRWQMMPRADRWLGSPSSAGWPPLQRKAPSVLAACEDGAIRFGVGGVFLRGSDGAPPVGSLVPFRLSFDDGGSFEGAAICRWARLSRTASLPAGMGLEILALPGDSLRTFEECLGRNPTAAYIPKR